jgi:hypothetical protein
MCVVTFHEEGPGWNLVLLFYSDNQGNNEPIHQVLVYRSHSKDLHSAVSYAILYGILFDSLCSNLTACLFLYNLCETAMQAEIDDI